MARAKKKRAPEAPVCVEPSRLLHGSEHVLDRGAQLGLARIHLPTLRRHRALALDHGGGQRGDSQRGARSPRGLVANFGAPAHAGRVAGVAAAA